MNSSPFEVTDTISGIEIGMQSVRIRRVKAVAQISGVNADTGSPDVNGPMISKTMFCKQSVIQIERPESMKTL